MSIFTRFSGITHKIKNHFKHTYHCVISTSCICASTSRLIDSKSSSLFTFRIFCCFRIECTRNVVIKCRFTKKNFHKCTVLMRYFKCLYDYMLSCDSYIGFVSNQNDGTQINCGRVCVCVFITIGTMNGNNLYVTLFILRNGIIVIRLSVQWSANINNILHFILTQQTFL